MIATTSWVTSVDAEQRVHIRPWISVSLDDLLTSCDETYPGEHILAIGEKRPDESHLHLTAAVTTREV